LQNFIKNNLCKLSRPRARVRDRNPSRQRRDLRPSRPRPRLEKTGLETRLETETKSRDSITDQYVHILKNFNAIQWKCECLVWVTDAWLPRKICFFLRNWNKFLISFWLNLHPTASRQATTCLKSLHFICVLGLVLIPHRKCPSNPRQTHAKGESVAPRATVARPLRSERDANSWISLDHRTNQLSRDNFARRVWCKPALIYKHSTFFRHKFIRALPNATLL